MSHNIQIRLLSHLTSPEGMGMVVDQKVGPELFEAPDQQPAFGFAVVED